MHVKYKTFMYIRLKVDFSMNFRSTIDTLGNVSQACSPTAYATLVLGNKNGGIQSVRNIIIKECNCIQTFTCAK